MEEGSPYDRIFLVLLLIIGIVILLRRDFPWSETIKENRWLIMLLAYMLISCLWSDISFLSFKRWVRQLIAVTMAFVVLTEADVQVALESLFRRVVYTLIPFSYILINYFAEYGRAYIHHSGILMWTGVTIHKNDLSHLCLFSSFFLIWVFFKRRKGTSKPVFKYQTPLEVFILLLTFWIAGGPEHSFTYSASTTAAFLTGLIIFVWVNWRLKRPGKIYSRSLILLVSVIFFVGTIVPFLGKLPFSHVTSALHRDQTLTGRTIVWKKLVPVAMDAPILGHGFGGFWTTEKREIFDISGSHNGYLDSILELGFVGLALVFIFILSISYNVIRGISRSFEVSCFGICFFIMMLLCNITETGLNSFTTKLTAVTLFIAVSSRKIIYLFDGKKMYGESKE